MPKKLFLFFVLLGLFHFQMAAQNNNDPVIFEINGKPIYKSEFMREFLRSVGKDPNAAPTACTYEKRQALTDYVDLFVNFRTKLVDAYAQGYDTVPTLVKELKGYRDELAAPYLIDSATMDRLLHEAYERNHYTLNAKHIFVKCSRNESPEDTLKAFRKINEFYQRVLNGDDFTTVAKDAVAYRFESEVVDPEDPRRKDNGDLGNFTVFDMVYSFESAAYALEPGQVSKPVRSDYGYHVIKLISKTPLFGKSTFQHIWFAHNSRADYTEYRANEAYKQLMDGTDWNKVCFNYSDDNTTAANGGLIQDAPVNKIPPEYAGVIASLKPGEISKPFQSEYGWHILKLLKRDSIASFDEMAPYYKQRMTRDSRSVQPRAQFIEQCKEKYHFKDYTKVFMKSDNAKHEKVYLASLDQCLAALNDSIYAKTWKFNDSMITDTRTLFSIADKGFNSVDFLKYIEAHQINGYRERNLRPLEHFMNTRYQSFIDEKVLEYADSQLEKENPEFEALINEYRNGLMIFSYNDKNIWGKAILDTVGFQHFYDKTSANHDINNEADAPYFWNERAAVTLIKVLDSSYIAPEKAMKVFQKATKKGWTKGQIADEIFETVKNNDHFSVTTDIVEQDHQNILKSNQWRKGIYLLPQPKGYILVRVDRLIDPCLKSIKEARGYYINDYQAFLEQQLIQNLRKKYNVIVHQDVIDEITY